MPNDNNQMSWPENRPRGQYRYSSQGSFGDNLMQNENAGTTYHYGTAEGPPSPISRMAGGRGRGDQYGRDMSQRSSPDYRYRSQQYPGGYMNLDSQDEMELRQNGRLIRGGIIYMLDETGQLVNVGTVGGSPGIGDPRYQNQGG